MSDHYTGLKVRDSLRRNIDWPVRIVIADQHREQVRFGTSASAEDRHVITGRAIDLSSTGMGVICRHFLPRMTEAVIHFLANPDEPKSSAPQSAGLNVEKRPVTAAHAQPQADHSDRVLYEQPVKVRRIDMLDNDPTYRIGLEFLEPPRDLTQQLTSALGIEIPEESLEVEDIPAHTAKGANHG